jgi:oxygen-dependent protoporphyrinogen oxidase
VSEIRETDDGYQIVQEDSSRASGVICCRRLVIASSIIEAGRLLAPLVPGALDDIRTIDSTSLTVLNLGFRRADVGHPLQGYGFLVPHHETGFPLMGVLWADSIFPHHAPADHRLIRVFIGGAHNPDAVSRSDDELLELVMRYSHGLLQLKRDPVLVDVCRYPAAIPQYHLGHVEKTERIRAAVASKPGLHLAGNYLGGVSLNDCIRVSTELAAKLIAETTSGVEPDSRTKTKMAEAAAV